MKTGILHRLTLLVCVALASCSASPAEEPSVVLEKAAAKAQTLDSAEFSASFSYGTETPAMELEGTADGTLADGGRQLSFSFNVDLTSPGEGFDQTVGVGGDVVVADEQETYLRLDHVTGSVPVLPGVGLVPTDTLNTWYLIGSASGSSTVTRDPSYVAMQTEVLQVTRDRSYEDVDGHDCYAYDVTIDRTKMLAFLERTASERGEEFDRSAATAFLQSYNATGTMWIDAQTYVIREITWNFVGGDNASGTEASLNVQLRGHNEPVEIVPPADAVPFEEPSDTSLPIF